MKLPQERWPTEPPSPYNVWREGVAEPSNEIKGVQLEKWVHYLQSVARQLKDKEAQLKADETKLRQRAWRWAKLINGLQKTISLQADQLGGYNPAEDARKALRELARFAPNQLPAAVRKDLEDVPKAERKIPLFCETFLYNTIGKDDARTVLFLLSRVATALGIDDLEHDEPEVESEEMKYTLDEVAVALRTMQRD